MLLLLSVLTGLVGLCAGQRTPTISYVTPPIVTKIGGTIEMDCSVLYATEYPILWVKLPGHCNVDRASLGIRSQISDVCTPVPLSSGSALIVRDNRFSMRYDTASSTYTLQIKDVQRPDEGVYQCQVIVAINNKVTKHVALTVSQPPEIADNSTRSVVVQENAPAELICHALGSPPPSVSWRRQNNAILPTGGVQYRGNILKIHAVKKEDRGTYYCVADNGVGKAVQRNVAVEVEFPPAVEGGGRIGQAMGYSVELVCHVEAYPRPTITWVHNGIQLSTNQIYAVDNGYLTADDFTETSVRVKKLGPRQLGSYFCRAQNKLGSSEREFVVSETYEPNCVVGLCEDFASAATTHHNNNNYHLNFSILTFILVVSIFR